MQIAVCGDAVKLIGWLGSLLAREFGYMENFVQERGIEDIVSDIFQ